MEKVNPKYEYHLLTWGGFYNKLAKKHHGYEPGDYWFETKEDRDKYVKELRNASSVNCLVTSTCEGYHTRVETILHRVVKVKETGELVYSNNNLGYGYPHGAAKYMMEYKWYPGFNDYEAIDDEEDFNKIEVVQEWVTGSFDVNEE